MQRRTFLKNLGMAVGGPIMLNGLGVSALSRSFLFNALGDSDKILVLVQLNGGNDGLNTLIPLDQYDNLANARSSILIPQNQILPLTNTLGFHPGMTGMKSLFDEGRIGLVHSVGYPDHNRSHFRSIEVMTSGSPPDEFWNTGWAGRYLDGEAPGYPTGYPNSLSPHPFAISMGYLVSETCQGQAANYAITLDDPFSPSNLAEWEGNEYMGSLYGYEYEYVREAIGMTNQYSQKIADAANLGNNIATYPDTQFAQQLKNVALLISGGLQTRIYTVSLGGFDTHSGQAFFENPGVGVHSNLLKTLSDGIKSFQDDLSALGLEDKVLGMTFSEFGRQIKENGSQGTDHGTAAPMILFGACTQGMILGDNPQIPANVGNQEGVSMQFDFRNVYGSILMDWFGLSQETAATMLFPEFQPLPVLACGDITSAQQSVWNAAQREIQLSVYPNPFSDNTNIQFSCGDERVRLSVFNALGYEVEVLADGKYGEGTHQAPFRGRNLPAGNYYCRIQAEGRQKTELMVKGR